MTVGYSDNGACRTPTPQPPNRPLQPTIAVGRPLRGLPLAPAAERRYVGQTEVAMAQGEAKLLSTHDGLCHFAEVAVEIDVTGVGIVIEMGCSGPGFQGQGALEDVPSAGYDDWKNGARAGVLFALRAVRVPHARVTVARITGVSSDTNPTVVAACAARAVWNALGISPPSDEVTRLDEIVAQSHLRPPTDVPDLG